MLSLATIRSRWGSLVGAFVALSLGVALMATAAEVLVSNVAHPPARLAAAPVVVHMGGPDSPPLSVQDAMSLSAALSEVPGVNAAISDYGFYAQPAGTDVTEGHGWSSAALAAQQLVVGAPPTTDSEVAIGSDLGIEVGSTVTIFGSAGPLPYSVKGVVDGQGLYFADGFARRSASGVRAIGLIVAPAADLTQVTAAAAALVGDRARVLVGDQRSALESETDAGQRDGGAILLGTMASISIFVSVFVVASTFALSVAQRRREFGLLRAVGATPRQVRRMIYGEAFLVGLVASACGAVLAIPLTPLLGSLLERARLVASGFTPTVVGWPLAAAAGAGLLVALMGVWSASRRAGRVRPMEALREAAVETRPMTAGRWIFGALFVVAGLGLSFGTVSSGPAAVLNAAAFAAMALITGLTLLAPVFIPPIAHVVAWPLAGLRGATGILVRENTLVAVRRTASTAAPVLLTVGLAALVTGVIATFAVAVRQDGVIDARSQTVVLPQGTPGLSDAAVAAVDDGQSTLMSHLYARLPDGSQQSVELAGVDPDVLPLAPGEIAIGAGYADTLGWQPGDTVTITFADGVRAPMRVSQITDDIDDDALAGGAVLPRPVVRAHDRSALTEAVFVTDGQPVAGNLEGLGAYVSDAAAYADARVAEEERLAKLVVLVLVGLSLAYTSIAIANTVLMATTGRVRDFAVLRLSGATVRQIIAMVAAEAALAVGIGAALGMAVAWTAVAGIAWGLSKDIGITIPVTMDWPVMSAVLTGCLVVAVLASIVPARLTLRAGTAALAGERD